MRKTKDLRTFSKRIETRYIALSDKMELNPKTRDNLIEIVKKINRNLDLIIQSLLVKIPDRQIPFLKVNLGEKVSNNQLRLLFADKNDDIDEEIPEYINIDDISHFIKFRITPGNRQIILSQEFSKINAEMLIDEEYIVCAATDIFLDIAMFNSFSYLRKMKDNDKKTFSSLKYSYYKEIGCNCYYHYKAFLEKEPVYFSFAFAARNNKSEIDLDTYIYLWNDFLSRYFSTDKDITELILEQLKYHKSYGQITKNDSTHEKIIRRFDSTGSKLILRINKKPKVTDKRIQIINYFGIPKFHLGTIKIVNLNEYYNPKLRDFLENGYVSAFKVIVTDYNIGKIESNS